jgi:hypothetical protein
MTETTGTKITFDITGINEIIEEKENQFTALREVQWGDRQSNLELRRWRNMPDGGEFPLKGATFMTPEGPSTLAETLVSLGFGNTKEILSSIKNRDDFRRSLNTVLGKSDELYDESAGEVDDDYYDPSELMKL